MFCTAARWILMWTRQHGQLVDLCGLRSKSSKRQKKWPSTKHWIKREPRGISYLGSLTFDDCPNANIFNNKYVSQQSLMTIMCGWRQQLLLGNILIDLQHVLVKLIDSNESGGLTRHRASRDLARLKRCKNRSRTFYDATRFSRLGLPGHLPMETKYLFRKDPAFILCLKDSGLPDSAPCKSIDHAGTLQPWLRRYAAALHHKCSHKIRPACESGR